MRKCICYLLILFIVPYSLVSCSEKKVEEPSKTPPSSEESFGNKEVDPNLRTISNEEIDSELSATFKTLESYLRKNSNESKLQVGQIPNGYGTLYQDLVFTQLNNVKGENSGSIQLMPVKETNDHHILYMIGFTYLENENPTLPNQFEDLFKLLFPDQVTTKSLSQYIGEIDKSPQKFPLSNSEVVIAKSSNNGKIKITVGYKVFINIK
ncbi:MAG: hypothetical protein ACRC7N_08110 [Clostridium sp.]